MFSKHRDAGFPFGCADAAAVDGRRDSNTYEVNPWLWPFGRGKPRLGGLFIQKTAEKKDAASDARRKSAAGSKRVRKDGSSLIRSKWGYNLVYTMMCIVYTRIYSYVLCLHHSFPAHVFFSL